MPVVQRADDFEGYLVYTCLETLANIKLVDELLLRLQKQVSKSVSM